MIFVPILHQGVIVILDNLVFDYGEFLKLANYVILNRGKQLKSFRSVIHFSTYLNSYPYYNYFYIPKLFPSPHRNDVCSLQFMPPSTRDDAGNSSFGKTCFF